MNAKEAADLALTARVQKKLKREREQKQREKSLSAKHRKDRADYTTEIKARVTREVVEAAKQGRVRVQVRAPGGSSRNRTDAIASYQNHPYRRIFDQVLSGMKKQEFKVVIEPRSDSFTHINDLTGNDWVEEYHFVEATISWEKK